MRNEDVNLTAHHISAMKAILSKGDRVLLIAVKDDVRIFDIDQKEVKIRKTRDEVSSGGNPV